MYSLNHLYINTYVCLLNAVRQWIPRYYSSVRPLFKSCTYTAIRHSAFYRFVPIHLL